MERKTMSLILMSSTASDFFRDICQRQLNYNDLMKIDLIIILYYLKIILSDSKNYCFCELLKYNLFEIF